MGRPMLDLDSWLEPFLAAVGHKKRKRQPSAALR